MSSLANHIPVLGMHHAHDAEPGVGTVLEVGTVPTPEVGRSGDCLTFTHLPSGWVQQKNRSPRQERIEYDTVAFWAGSSGARILTLGGPESDRTGRPVHLHPRLGLATIREALHVPA